MKTMAKHAFAATILSVSALNVNAATVNLGYGKTDLIANPTGGAFSDIYNIVLTSFGSIDYTITAINETLAFPVSFTPLSYVNVDISKFQDSTFAYGLYDASDVKIYDPSALIAGTYTLKVSGITSGQFGGKYSLNAEIVSLPVPEPESNIMMLLGLLSIGTLVYRKKQF